MENTRARIDRSLTRMGLSGPHVRVVALTGDASTRQYFRIIRPDGPSVVLAVYDQPFEHDTLPFVNVAALLKQVPLPIPDILGHADDAGVLALEDLGDVTLQAHLGGAPAPQHDALYREAVGYIERLQRRGRELTSPRYVPFGVAFDRAKLVWELDFFAKHFLTAYRGVALTTAIRAVLEQEWAAIADELAAEPRVLCHRDYHSRNLMLRAQSLYIIDFQDARMGPDTYDLASLLRDSYVDLSEETIDALIGVFLTLRDQSGTGSATEFRRRFDLMSLQRGFKALGTFGHQTTARHNPVYIQYIPRTLRHIRRNLERYPRFGRLREVLAVAVEELRPQ